MSKGNNTHRALGRRPAWAAIGDARGAGHTGLNWPALGFVVGLWLILELGVIFGGLTPPAFGASATNAIWSGVGTYTNPQTGVVYGANGGQATLTVTTTNDTKCVSLNPNWTNEKPTQTSNTAKTNWVFPLTLPTSSSTYSVTASASPNFNAGGNCTGSTPGNTTATASIVVDTTGPSVTGVPTPAPNAAGWNKTDVSIAWTAADGGSGIASGPTPASDTVTTETPVAGVVKTSTATDNVGNTATGSLTIRLDETAPSIDATRNPAPNSFGWNDTNVTVGFTCADALSGIKSCTGGGSVIVSTEGTNQSVAGKAVDNADNENTAGVGSINIDKTNPTLSGAPTTAPNGDGWYNGNVQIAWTAADDRSGIASAPANSTLSGEGAGLYATTSVSDKAGNSVTADSSKVDIDRTPPTTDAVADTAWSKTAQTILLQADDALSGVKSTHYKLDDGASQSGTSVEVSGDGLHSLEYWSVDKAGNAEAHKTVQVRIDGTSPTIDFSQSPLANTNGWNNGNVTVKFVCNDETSGIASCTADQVVSDEGANQAVEGTATDNAGNSVSATAHVSIDKTAPQISAATDRDPNNNLAANGAGWYAGDVTVSFQCSDSLSGIDTCPSPVTLAEGYDQSVSRTATDAAGNTASAGVGKVNVDKTSPTLSGSATSVPNSAGWYKDDVTIAWTCSDALSGIAGSCPADTVLDGEGDDLLATASVTDKAGNQKSASAAAVKIDRTLPSTTAGFPAPLASGWYAGAVDVTLTAVDNLSGVAKTFYSVDGGAPTEYTGKFAHSLGGTHTITFWSVDAAGNAEDKSAAANTITLKIDNVKPSIDGSRLPAANSFGWNNGPVEVSFDCLDAESGIAGCVGDTVLSEQTTAAGVSVTGNAQDNAGNTNEATVGPVKIDLGKPTLSGTPTTADNAYGWYGGDVTIAWDGQDGLSGIDPATLPADSVISGEGSGLKAGPKTVKDKAGNESDPTYSTAVNIDRSAPTISAKTVNEDGTARSANAAGWFNSAIRVRFSCNDSLSGIAECPADVVLDQDGTGLGTSGTATDKAGNTANGSITGLKLDSLAPVSVGDLVCTSKNGYCRGTKATVNITAADPSALDGVTTSGVKEIRYRVNGGAVSTTQGSSAVAQVPLSGNGKAIVEFWAVDNAGNSEGQPTPNKVELTYDTLAPLVSHTLAPAAANAAGWNNVDTTVHFDAVDDGDGGSGVDPATVTPDVLVDAETAGLLVKGQADDFAGNTGYDAVTVKLDKTKPTITATPSGTLGANGWYRSVVTVQFACADPTASNGAAASGIATCTGQQSLGHGDTVTGTAEDRADNRRSLEVGPFKVDTDAPVVDVNGVADGGQYTLGSVPSGSCSATDVGASGIDGACSYTVTGGLANGVGTFNFVATAKDNAGNVRTVNGSYRVVYSSSSGTAFWLQPINDTAHTQSTTLSVFKSGSTVPAKFRLLDANGQVVQTNTAPQWLAPVKGSATTAPVDESVYTEAATSGDTYKWSSTDQHYQFNWASPKNGAGWYWRIGVRLDDGTTRTVNIGLR